MEEGVATCSDGASKCRRKLGHVNAIRHRDQFDLEPAEERAGREQADCQCDADGGWVMQLLPFALPVREERDPELKLANMSAVGCMQQICYAIAKAGGDVGQVEGLLEGR